MDPITLIVTALALGAAAGLKPTAEQAIKDGYNGLKTLIQRKYGGVSMDGLEKKPESTVQQGAVKEQLADTGAEQDEELLDRAKELLDLIKSQAPETVATAKIKIEEVEAAYLKAKDAIARGQKAEAEVEIRRSRFKEGIELGSTIADSGEASSPNSHRQ